MIVTDLDGTLLRTDKTISEYTNAILGRCRLTGIKVVYATGRGGSAEECGIGVAVASAVDECGIVADFFCGDCDNDGVAKWLDENIIRNAGLINC